MKRKYKQGAFVIMNAEISMFKYRYMCVRYITYYLSQVYYFPAC